MLPIRRPGRIAVVLLVRGEARWRIALEIVHPDIAVPGDRQALAVANCGASGTAFTGHTSTTAFVEANLEVLNLKTRQVKIV